MILSKQLSIISVKSISVPVKDGIRKQRYVSTLKSVSFDFDKSVMNMYYVTHLVDENATSTKNGTTFGAVSDSVDIDMLVQVTDTIENMIVDKFIEYANKNKLYSFSEYVRFKQQD